MSKQFTLPAVFTAIDKFSGPMGKMTGKAETSMARMERKFRKTGDAAFRVSKKSAVLATSIIAPLGLVANESVKFEKSMANVSTLIDTNTENIGKMGEEVLELSTKLPVPIEELTSSLYDIRSAGIAAEDSMLTLNESAKLSATGLSTVEESTDIMTSAMNAFKSEGLTAAQTADILFKTVKFGKTTVAELSQSFGASAPLIQEAGVKLADFQAATAAITTLGTPATVAQNQLKTAIAKLKGPTAEMEKVFKALGVTTEKELIQKYGTLGDSFAAVNKEIERQGLSAKKTWGSVEALSGATALTTQVNESYVSTLQDMTEGTNAINGAFEKQSSTGAASMQLMKNNLQALAIQLGNAVIPLITEMVAAITPVVKSMAKWMKNNKSTVKTIVKVAAVVGGLAAAVSLVSGVVGIATKAFGIYQAILKAGAIATKVITAIQWLWNAAMMANPIGAIIALVAGLAVGIYALSKAFSTQTAAERLNTEVRERALEASIDQRVEVTMLFHALRKAKVGTEEYNSTLQKLEAIQPGIIEQYNLMEGKLEDINRAEKDLTASILKRAEAEARAEMIKEKFKEAQEARDKGGTGSAILDFALSTTPGLNSDKIKKDFGNMRAVALENEAKYLAQQQAEEEMADKKKINPKKTEQVNTNNNNTTQNVTVDFKNLPPGTEISGAGGGLSGGGVKIGTTR